MICIYSIIQRDYLVYLKSFLAHTSHFILIAYAFCCRYEYGAHFVAFVLYPTIDRLCMSINIAT